VLGEEGAVTSSAEQVDLDEKIESPFVTQNASPSPVTKEASTDDTMSYFAKLAAEA
jgi:hypothetical protein